MNNTLPPLPEPWADTINGWAFTETQVREYAAQAVQAEREKWFDEVQYRYGFNSAEEIRARGEKT